MSKLLLLVLFVSICPVKSDPKLIALKNVSPMVISKITGVETGSSLYVASNDDVDYLKRITIQTGNTSLTLDQLNSDNPDGSAQFFSIIDGLSISTSNDYDVSISLTGVIYVTTKQQADDPNFFVYVIKSNNTIKILPESKSNSAVVILNTALKSENSDDPLKTSYVTNINLSSEDFVNFHYGYPPGDWRNVSLNQFFENPLILWNIDDDDGSLKTTRVFFDTIEPLQINSDYWYFTTSGPIQMQIQNKYMEELNHTTSSVNTTGLIVNNYKFREHVVNFELDYTRTKTVGMLITATPVATVNFFYLVQDRVMFEESFNNQSHADHWFSYINMQATNFVVNSTAEQPGSFYCQYFGVAGNLLPVSTTRVSSTTLASSTTVIPSTTTVMKSTVLSTVTTEAVSSAESSASPSSIQTEYISTTATVGTTTNVVARSEAVALLMLITLTYFIMLQ